jgi:predicted hotdog family 3-hydroxylacyl-ACP dehydratase
MAQCLAAHGGLLGRSQGEPPRVGFLVGARGIVFHRAHFEPGEDVVVEACPRRSTAGLFDFACKVEARDGTPIAEGRVQCFVQEGLEALRRMGWKEKRS